MSTTIMDLSLKNFVVFNNKYGQKEGEEQKKIMYFFPKETDLDAQIKEVGLSQAVIKFCDTFSGGPCQALQTEKTRRLFYEPEPDFCMVMTLNVPIAKKGKDGLEGHEYRGSEVQNSVFLAVLKHSYEMSKLFLGPFSAILEANSGDTEPLKKKLDSFFTKYLQTLSLAVKNCDILDLFQGVTFLPLDKATFLHAQCFINCIEAAFPSIDFSLLLYKDQLVWSGLPPNDAQIVFRYVIASLLPSNKLESQGRSYPQQESKFGRFITGPMNITDLSFSGKLPKVYLSSEVEPGFYNLIVYKLMNTTLCLFQKDSDTLTMDLFRELDRLCNSKLGKVNNDLDTYKSNSDALHGGFGVGNGDGEDVKFVYFNSMNLATKSTIHSKSDPKNMLVTRETLRILVDLHNANRRIAKSNCLSGETIVKTLSDHWVVGKMSNSREFYVTIDKKKTNLVEVNDEANKICDKYLKNIFFHV